MSHVRTTADSLYAMQCVLLTLVGPADEVLLVDHIDERFALAAKLTRTRTRHVTANDVFDAIGAHTRALVLVDPDEAALELAAFELPLILLMSQRGIPLPVSLTGKNADALDVRVEIRVSETGTEVHHEGLSTTMSDELGRWMDAALKGPCDE